MPQAPKGPSVAWQPASRGNPGDYAGWETCAGCHRAEAQSFVKTPHAHAGEKPPTSPLVSTAGMSPSAAAGKKIYDDMMCAGCHAIGGQGGTGGGALDDVGERRTRAQILERMQQRRAGSVMPPLPSDMPDQKINQLVDYMMTLTAKTEAVGKPPAASAPTGVSGCEACHGPGKAHAEAEQEAGGDPAKQAAATKLIFKFDANPKENSERCLACHVSSRHQEMFSDSAHASASVGCNECHASHLVADVHAGNKRNLASAQGDFFEVPQLLESRRWLQNSLLKQSDPALCFSCHGNIQALFALPVHHRVPEQLMKCTDCHNPHGSINRASLNATNWETCVKCHVEKRGPYLYEHPAVRVSGCVICHNPHGSTNRMLLVRREGRALCLQCHTGFHAQAGVPHSRLGFQASGECTRCHVTVHGSNFDSNFLR
jgi:predicted CXXCH cytochrome family protein